MNFGYIKKVSKNKYITKNGVIKFELSVKNEHVYVKIKGGYKRTGITNIKKLNEIEKMILINYLYLLIEKTGYISYRELDNLNYAGIFGGNFSIGSK